MNRLSHLAKFNQNILRNQIVKRDILTQLLDKNISCNEFEKLVKSSEFENFTKRPDIHKLIGKIIYHYFETTYFRSKNFEIVKYLISNYPNCNGSDKWMSLTLYKICINMCSNHDSYKMIELMLTHPTCDLDIVDKTQNNILMVMIKDGNHNLVKLLLDHRPRYVNCKNKFQNTPLLYSIYHSDYKMVKLILSYNPRINDYNKQNITPLYAACTQGKIKFVKKILKEEDIDINIRTKTGLNVLNIVSNQNILKLLLKKNIDINAKSPLLNETTLIFAARLKNIQKINFLIEYGCDLNIKNSEGETYLDLLNEEQKIKIYPILKKRLTSSLLNQCKIYIRNNINLFKDHLKNLPNYARKLV